MRSLGWSDEGIEVAPEVERIAAVALDAAFAVHTAVGPGARETVHVRLLQSAIERRGVRVEREKWIPILFEGATIENALRADLVLDGSVVLEVKAVDVLNPLHKRQLLAYLKAGRFPLGFLFNFHVERFRAGFTRVVNTR